MNMKNLNATRTEPITMLSLTVRVHPGTNIPSLRASDIVSVHNFDIKCEKVELPRMIAELVSVHYSKGVTWLIIQWKYVPFLA